MICSIQKVLKKRVSTISMWSDESKDGCRTVFVWGRSLLPSRQRRNVVTRREPSSENRNDTPMHCLMMMRLRNHSEKIFGDKDWANPLKRCMEPLKQLRVVGASLNRISMRCLAERSGKVHRQMPSGNFQAIEIPEQKRAYSTHTRPPFYIEWE